MAGNLLRVGPTATLGYQFPRTLALVAFNFGFTCCRLTMPGFILTRTCFDLAYSVPSGSIALSSARRCGAAAGRRSRGGGSGRRWRVFVTRRYRRIGGGLGRGGGRRGGGGL